MQKANKSFLESVNPRHLIIIKNIIYFICGIILLLFSLPFILLLTLEKYEYLDDSFAITGTIGDTLNGIFNPLIGTFAVITTFLAFIVQYRANQLYREDVDSQRFETRFYELLKMHKDNVNEMEINNKYFKRNTFVKMFEELRFLYFVIENAKEQFKIEKNYPIFNITKEGIIELAYFFFFFGVNEKLRIEDFSKIKVHSPFYLYCREKIYFHQDYFIRSFSEKEKEPITMYLDSKNSYSFSIYLKTDFYPFDGHASRLGHYYRHLYQMIKFVVLSKELRNFDQKYEYIKIIRAQLSNYEQAIIYYNSFFYAGKVWWEDTSIDLKKDDGKHVSYLLDYALIKNLPFNLIDFGVPPEEKFTQKLKQNGLNQAEVEVKLKWLFEWMEINNNL